MQSHSFSTAIPLLAHPSTIDPSSFVRDITELSQAPDLKIREGCFIQEFSAAGGRHRMEAVKELHRKEGEKIKGLEGRIETLKKGGQQSATAKEKMKDLRRDLRKSKVKMDGLGKWTVILYDESKCI